MRGRDPSSSPRTPRNVRSMWCCAECGEWNEPENSACFACDMIETRPIPDIAVSDR